MYGDKSGGSKRKSCSNNHSVGFIENSIVSSKNVSLFILLYNLNIK